MMTSAKNDNITKKRKKLFDTKNIVLKVRKVAKVSSSYQLSYRSYYSLNEAVGQKVPSIDCVYWPITIKIVSF